MDLGSNTKEAQSISFTIDCYYKATCTFLCVNFIYAHYANLIVSALICTAEIKYTYYKVLHIDHAHWFHVFAHVQSVSFSEKWKQTMALFKYFSRVSTLPSAKDTNIGVVATKSANDDIRFYM